VENEARAGDLGERAGSHLLESGRLRSKILLITAAGLIGLACRSNPPEKRMESDYMPVEQHYDCYLPDGHFSPITTLKAGPFSEDEMDILVGLWQQIVAPHQLWEAYAPVRPIDEVVITLATQAEKNIPPSDEFILRIATDTLRVRAPIPDERWAVNDPRHIALVELKLWGWANADTAKVQSLVWWNGWGTSRASIAVREPAGWKLCTTRGIGMMN